MSEIDPKDTSVAAALMRAVESTDDVEFLKQVIRTQLKRAPELWAVGKKEFAVVPNGDNMTEEMLDASRPVHRFYEGENGGVSCEEMLEYLYRRAPWCLKYVPEWMLDGGHLTKRGRGALAYALTVAAYTDPKNFKVKPTPEEIKRILGERITDEKILAKIDEAVLEDLEDAPVSRADIAVHLLTGFTALMEYDLNGATKSFPMRCTVHPPIELDGTTKKMVSVLVSRSDVPREVRSLVKRNGTKIMFTLGEGQKIERGPYMVDTSGKPAASQVRCVKIDSLIAKRGVSKLEALKEAMDGRVVDPEKLQTV